MPYHINLPKIYEKLTLSNYGYVMDQINANMVNTFIDAINKKKGTNHGKDK